MLDRIAAEQHVSDAGSWWLYPFLVAAVSAPAAVGALIVARQARNPIGWILVVGALSLAAVLAASPYAWVALDAHPGSLPGGSWAALVSSLWPVFFAWPLAVAFVFPDGRLPSRRWRPYALFAAGSMTLLMVVLVLADRARGAVRGRAESVPASAAGRSRLSATRGLAVRLRQPVRRRCGGPGSLQALQRDRAAADALVGLCGAPDPVGGRLVPRLGPRGRRGRRGEAVVAVPARNGGGGGDRGRRGRDPLPVVRDRSADQPDARLQRRHRVARPGVRRSSRSSRVSLSAGVRPG